MEAAKVAGCRLDPRADRAVQATLDRDVEDANQRLVPLKSPRASPFVNRAAISKATNNIAGGFNRSIADRFDLTLECIRRHYVDQASPLASTLSRYADFFALFGDFRGYVSFFLLDDLVTDDCSVKFFMPFDDFRPAVGPQGRRHLQGVPPPLDRVHRSQEPPDRAAQRLNASARA